MEKIRSIRGKIPVFSRVRGEGMEALVLEISNSFAAKQGEGERVSESERDRETERLIMLEGERRRIAREGNRECERVCVCARERARSRVFSPGTHLVLEISISLAAKHGLQMQVMFMPGTTGQGRPCRCGWAQGHWMLSNHCGYRTLAAIQCYRTLAASVPCGLPAISGY